MSKDNPKILVVEDEPDVCNCLQSYLGRRGFLVSTTPSGIEALSIIKISQPDIVILDLKLSDINGKDALKSLREYDKKTKVIVITGEILKDEEIDEIHSIGITEYLHKPILLEKLEGIIGSILGEKFILKPQAKIAK